MRLLAIQSNGSISFTEDLYDNIPPYAILSHTWETNAQEVRMTDVKAQTAHSKLGYRKIEFCRKQAIKDGLLYFWIDSCCINQENDIELTRSINSMFRWYRDATKCYVYLSDVPDRPENNASQWQEAFRRSRWFTRGWTLQELLAPCVIEFFSAQGQSLGDKKSLEDHIHSSTGIPISALRGTPPSTFSIEERFSWAKNRQTKIPEDKVYCLLGLFDIHMPLIYGEGEEHAFKRLRKEIEAYRNEHPKPFSTVPFGRDHDFVDRPGILSWMSQKCNQPAARVALVGIGGAGKSQAVIEYAYRLRDKAPQTWVFWVHASTRARIDEAYKGICERLNLPDRNSPNVNIYQLLGNWLCDELNGPWLLILDNADDSKVFLPQRKAFDTSPPLWNYLPQSSHGSIIVTSRNRETALKVVADVDNVIQVPSMAEDQAERLIRNKLHGSGNLDDIEALSRTLDHIPLAITQACAYINRRRRVTIRSYLNEFENNVKRKETILDRELGDLRRDGSASSSISITWSLSFENVREESQSAADLLCLISFFNPHQIPDWALRSFSEKLSPTDDNGLDVEFDEDLDLLEDLSFVTESNDGTSYEIHALVQFCVRAWLSSLGAEEEWRLQFLDLMAREFPQGDLSDRAKSQQLMPHLESLYDLETSDIGALAKWARLLTNAAWFLWQEGNYGQAKSLAMKALETRERASGTDNSSTLTTMSVLASVLRSLGNYQKSEKIGREVMNGYYRLFGPEHLDAMTSASNLALILRDQAKFEEAKDIYEKVLEGRKSKLGPRHHDTLTSISNLSLVWRDLGFYDKAASLTRQALEGREEVLGKSHPSTLNSASNLALLLQEQGKLEESERLSRQVLEAREAELGETHPHTLASASNLASVLEDQGKCKEAEEINRRVLGAYEETSGLQHPSTLTSVSNLAFVLQEQGKYLEAERLNRRALEGRQIVLGTQHPDSLTSKSNLAFSLRLQERYTESEILNREVLKDREEKIGKQHIDTLTTVNNLALVLTDQGKYKEAEDYTRSALEGYSSMLGPNHPYALTSLSNLAGVLHDQKRYMEAEGINREVLEAYEKKFGLQHPDTLRSVSNLAELLQDQGKYIEAEELWRRSLKGREVQLGRKHPDTVKSLTHLVETLQHQGKLEEADALNKEVQEATDEAHSLPIQLGE